VFWETQNSRKRGIKLVERRRYVLFVKIRRIKEKGYADDRLLLNPNWLLDPRLLARQMIWRLTMMSWRMTISCNPHVSPDLEWEDLIITGR